MIIQNLVLVILGDHQLEIDYDNIYKGHLILKAIIAGEAANDATGTLYYLELQFIDRLTV